MAGAMNWRQRLGAFIGGFDAGQHHRRLRGFPMGTFDTFTTYGGPANLLETANTVGLPLYARQMMDAKGRWIDLMTEASILPVNKRPRLAIRLHSSN